jgi:integrase/recombinase XerD
MTPLRKGMIQDLQIRNYSPRTIRTYVRTVAGFARHHGRSPEVLGTEDIRSYQVHLLEAKTGWSVFSQTVCALRFLYGVTLQRDWPLERLLSACGRRSLGRPSPGPSRPGSGTCSDPGRGWPAPGSCRIRGR